MKSITFKEFYEAVSVVVDNINVTSKISRLKKSEVDIIQNFIGKDDNQKITKLNIVHNNQTFGNNDGKKAYYTLAQYICSDSSIFEVLKGKHYFFGEDDRSVRTSDYNDVGRQGYYIYTNCNLDLLMSKSVKMIIDAGLEEELDSYHFEIEVNNIPDTNAGDEISDDNLPTSEEVSQDENTENSNKYKWAADKIKEKVSKDGFSAFTISTEDKPKSLQIYCSFEVHAFISNVL